MTASNYSICPVNTTDVPDLVEFLYLLKTGLTFNRVVFKYWPNEAAQKALYRATIESTLAQTSTSESLKAVDDETGEIIGYVTVSRESPTQSLSGQQQHSNAEGVNSSRGQEETEHLDGIHLEVYAAAVGACLELQRRNDTREHLDTNKIPSG